MQHPEGGGATARKEVVADIEPASTYQVIDLGANGELFPKPSKEASFSHPVLIVDQAHDVKEYVLFESGSFGLRAVFKTACGFGPAYLAFDQREGRFCGSAYNATANATANEVLDVKSRRPELLEAIDRAFEALSQDIKAKLLPSENLLAEKVAFQELSDDLKGLIKTYIILITSNESTITASFVTFTKKMILEFLKKYYCPNSGDQELLTNFEDLVRQSQESH